MTSKEMYIQFAHDLVRAGINATTSQELDLMEISKSLHRIDENDCNGYSDGLGNWNEQAEKKAERREERLTAKAEAIAKELDCVLYRQGDPRGWPLDLIPIKVLIEKAVYYLDEDEKLSQETRAYISSNYSQIGIAVPPF